MLGNAGEDVIDEYRFHNCVSPFGSSANKRISLPIMKTHIKFNDFIHICLDTISEW